jgi:hydrogenase maturation protein HypF
LFLIEVKGVVQGVGFRPFIYRLAKEYNLNGSVSNSSNGVEIYIDSHIEIVESFIDSIHNRLPSLAEIDSVDIEEVEHKNFVDFKIIENSNGGDVSADIPADISICKECEAELFDPTNRRFGYPFITCTDCGVRYSIIYDLPYDREKTSMKFFNMCKVCREEYNNPSNRRYHAQPIGCWDCGATLSLWSRDGELLVNSRELIDRAVELILDGSILALKGVGGYHLLCDATNEDAIRRLRERKKRVSKPFAVMVKDIEMAHKLAKIDKMEEEILTSKERPIVLLDAYENRLPSIVSPNISRIGLFLPYTPIHLLILQKLNRPLIATSANISDEPIATDFESVKRLSGIYDYLIEHNRDIVNGCDDSVVMVVKDRVIFIRRARGYTPISIKLPFRLEKKLLAVGANQKSTVAIGFDNRVILSPHIGDLESIASINYFKENIQNLQRIYRFEPEVVIYDKHPNYESSRYAKSLDIERREIQHHYAHILSVMAERSITQRVLGVSFDGTGYGDDGNLWGGEFMVCDYGDYDRVYHFRYFRLLGGAKAIREPKRVALSLLFDIYGEDSFELDNPTINAFTKSELRSHYILWGKGLNSPLSSSVGRLFDAVASLTDISQTISFEGESGMKMEEYYEKGITSYYSFTIEDGTIDILPMIEEMIEERSQSVAISKFFNTLVEILYIIYKKYNLPLVLSGGVFQNRVLLRLILDKIPTAVAPNRLPPNDGGIALGQIFSYNGALKRVIV